MTPGRFIEILSKSSAALVFRIVVPSELLYSSDRHEIAGFIHQTAAEIERYAISKGDPAIGFAGGACKEIFCREFEDCHVIHHQKKCRFGEHSRNSMSGLGVNFNKLNEIPGWNNHTKKGGEKTATGMMAGMVLFL
jgi:predicted metal-binding protein